jgi:hypothetical protein
VHRGEVSRLEPVQEFAYLRLDEFPVEDPHWHAYARPRRLIFASRDLDRVPVEFADCEA